MSDSPSSEQPTEFPVDFAEWAAALRETPYRTLLAGFGHHVRLQGGLLRKRLRAEWDAGFTEFQARRPAA
jgi:hypothetical protein